MGIRLKLSNKLSIQMTYNVHSPYIICLPICFVSIMRYAQFAMKHIYFKGLCDFVSFGIFIAHMKLRLLNNCMGIKALKIR